MYQEESPSPVRRKRTASKRLSSILKGQNTCLLTEGGFTEDPRTPKRVSFAQSAQIREFWSIRSDESCTSNGNKQSPVINQSQDSEGLSSLQDMAITQNLDFDAVPAQQRYYNDSSPTGQNRTIHFNELDSSVADMNMTCDMGASISVCENNVETCSDDVFWSNQMPMSSNHGLDGMLRWASPKSGRPANIDVMSNRNKLQMKSAGFKPSDPLSEDIEPTMLEFTHDDMDLTADLTMSTRFALADISSSNPLHISNTSGQAVNTDSFVLEGQENNPLIIHQTMKGKEGTPKFISAKDRSGNMELTECVEPSDEDDPEIQLNFSRNSVSENLDLSVLKEQASFKQVDAIGTFPEGSSMNTNLSRKTSISRNSLDITESKGHYSTKSSAPIKDPLHISNTSGQAVNTDSFVLEGQENNPLIIHQTMNGKEGTPKCISAKDTSGNMELTECVEPSDEDDPKIQLNFSRNSVSENLDLSELKEQASFKQVDAIGTFPEGFSMNTNRKGLETMNDKISNTSYVSEVHRTEDLDGAPNRFSTSIDEPSVSYKTPTRLASNEEPKGFISTDIPASLTERQPIKGAASEGRLRKKGVMMGNFLALTRRYSTSFSVVKAKKSLSSKSGTYEEKGSTSFNRNETSGQGASIALRGGDEIDGGSCSLETEMPQRDITSDIVSVLNYRRSIDIAPMFSQKDNPDTEDQVTDKSRFAIGGSITPLAIHHFSTPAKMYTSFNERSHLAPNISTDYLNKSNTDPLTSPMLTSSQNTKTSQLMAVGPQVTSAFFQPIASQIAAPLQISTSQRHTHPLHTPSKTPSKEAVMSLPCANSPGLLRDPMEELDENEDITDLMENIDCNFEGAAPEDIIQVLDYVQQHNTMVSEISPSKDQLEEREFPLHEIYSIIGFDHNFASLPSEVTEDLTVKFDTLKEKLEARVTAIPKVTALKQFVQKLEEKVDQLWQQKEEQQKKMRGNLSSLGAQLTRDQSSETQKLQSIVLDKFSACKLAARKSWSCLKAKHILEYSEKREEAFKKIKSEMEQFQQDSLRCQEIIKDLDDCLQKVNLIQEGKKEIASKEALLAEEKNAIKSLEQESQRLDEEVKDVLHASENLDVEYTEQTQACKTIEDQLSWRSKLTEWNRMEQTSQEIKFGFLHDTLVLHIQFSICGESGRRPISKIFTRSRLSDSSTPWAKLCHQLAVDSLDCNSLMQKFPTENHLPMLLLGVSRISCSCRQLSTEISQANLRYRVSIKQSSVDIYMLNRKKRSKIQLQTSLKPPCRYPETRMTWTVSTMLGKDIAEQIRQAVDRVEKGSRYLSRTLQAAEKAFKDIYD